MIFDVRNPDGAILDDIARHYEEHGFCRIAGIGDTITPAFYPLLAEALGPESSRLPEILETDKPALLFDKEVRQRLARVATTPALTHSIFGVLSPVLERLIGPLAHISSTFHAQFKWGAAIEVDHGGYAAGSDYMEVHGPYLLHQDFAGASLPTSPSAVTLWVGLNSCPDWNLRLYPGSHKLGLVCNRWLSLDDPRLQTLRQPVDIQAEPGTAVLFNALLLHGTSNGGTRRRVSCDIRFFPLCAFLPTEAHLLNPTPLRTLRERLRARGGETLREPIEETRVFLGERIQPAPAAPFSVLNWANYINERMHGDPEAAVQHLRAFVNTDIGADPAEVYISKFHNYPIERETLRRLHAKLANCDPEAFSMNDLARFAGIP